MYGYYSIDGGAVVRAKISVNHNLSDIWAKALMIAKETEFSRYNADFFYSVRECNLKRGQKYYKYAVEIVNSDKVSFYTILIDLKGYAQIDIRYGAQRCENKLNLSYRDWFKFAGFHILEERICRVDLAITLDSDASSIIRDVLEGRFRSLLSRRYFNLIGDPDSPSYVRLGRPDNIEVAIYDKRLEMMENSYKLSYKEKLEDYLERFQDADHVTRLEFRLFRNYLQNVEVNTPDDVNKELFSLWATMVTRYFVPTKTVYDGHHEAAIADWWLKLPPLGVNLKAKTKQGPIMFNVITRELYRAKTYVSREWYGKHRDYMNRAEGYIASIAASIARVPENLDTAIQVVFRRLLKEGDLIYARARSRFALEVVQ